jgi:hypothetical protein
MSGLSPLFKRKGGSDAQKTWRLAERPATIILSQLTTNLGVNLIPAAQSSVERIENFAIYWSFWKPQTMQVRNKQCRVEIENDRYGNYSAERLSSYEGFHPGVTTSIFLSETPGVIDYDGRATVTLSRLA